MNSEFKKYLEKSNLSENTISSYIATIKMFNKIFGDINKKNLLAFKGYMIENYKPKTVNLRIQAINKYLIFINKKDLICFKVSDRIIYSIFLRRTIRSI